MVQRALTSTSSNNARNTFLFCKSLQRKVFSFDTFQFSNSRFVTRSNDLFSEFKRFSKEKSVRHRFSFDDRTFFKSKIEKINDRSCGIQSALVSSTMFEMKRKQLEKWQEGRNGGQKTDSFVVLLSCKKRSKKKFICYSEETNVRSRSPDDRCCSFDAIVDHDKLD